MVNKFNYGTKIAVSCFHWVMGHNFKANYQQSLPDFAQMTINPLTVFYPRDLKLVSNHKI